MSIIVLGCSTVLGGLSIMTYHSAMKAAADDRAAFVRFTDVATALNRIAAERGPTNAALTAPLTTAQVLARDTSIAAPTAALAAALAAARHTADHVLSRPVANRSAEEIEATIEGMFAVIDDAQDLTEEAMQPIGTGMPSTILAMAQTIRMLSELRDYAGRMGSALIVPLATDTPVDAEQRSAFDTAHGRVLALGDMLQHAVPLASHGALSSDYRAAWQRFLSEGGALFDAALASGQDGHHDMNAADFTLRIMPVFHQIEEVRDRFFTVVVATLEDHERRARYTFLAVSLATLLMVVLECALLVATQALVFRPLMTALQTVLRLAKGSFDPLPEEAIHWGEMRDLFKALTLLASRLRERDALDRQNVVMADRLRRLAEQDGLTGILNRGTLERAAAALSAAAAGHRTLGLILLDLDHFKAINDTFGHGVGDTVLKVTADRLRQVLDHDAIFARFGGEEFAVVMPDRSPAELWDLAERLRGDIAVPVDLPSGAMVPVTASLGLATCPCGPEAWSRLIDRADAGLYRAKAAGRNTVVCGDDPAFFEADRSAA